MQLLHSPPTNIKMGWHTKQSPGGAQAWSHNTGMIIYTAPRLGLISIQDLAGDRKIHQLSCFCESASVHWATSGPSLASKATRSICTPEMELLAHRAASLLFTISPLFYLLLPLLRRGFLLTSNIRVWVGLHPTSNSKQLPKTSSFLEWPSISHMASLALSGKFYLAASFDDSSLGCLSRPTAVC